MAEKLNQHRFDNGMMLLGEPVEGVGSAAFVFMLPIGAALLPDGCGGAGNVIADWVFRGAGEMTSRQVVDALDGLGLQRASAVNCVGTILSGALEAGNLSRAIEVYADVILRPHLTDEQFCLARELAVHELAALADDPRHKVMLDLREQFYPQPLGRSPMGTEAQLSALSPETTRQLVRDGFDVSNTVVAVAGRYDWQKLVSMFERLFGGAPAKSPRRPQVGERGCQYLHMPNDGAQVHIGIMTPTVTVEDDDYYAIRAAADILGGSMSARLFTEVREKRGLCYAVGARYHCLKGCAGVMCYAGTTPEKAQETLDVTIGEMQKLVADGVTDAETQRAKVGLKSSLIMGSESTSARAGAIAGDWHLFGRVRSMDEIRANIEKLTAEALTSALKRHPFSNFTIVSIGPRAVAFSR